MEYSQLPEWNAQGVEPPQTKKSSGWQPGERPPAPWFNWLFHRIYQSFIEIRNAFNSHEEAAQGVHGLAPTESVESTAGAQAKAEAAASAALLSAQAYADQAVAAHAARTDNPHGVTKFQVGLGNVENYPVASQREAEAGTASDRYMTPERTAQAIASLAPVKSVAGRTGAVTLSKSDVGLGNVENYGIATQAEAEAGSVNNKYMTPLRVAQAIAALHANRRDNPHQVTAAQLGLGDVLTHLAQILGSRIVDHNLDVTTAPARYVRLDNGLQVCYGTKNFSNLDCRSQISTSGWYTNSGTNGLVTFPAQFRSLGDYEVIAVEKPWWGIVPQEGLGVISVTRQSAGSFSVRVSRFGSGVIPNTDVGWIAIGRWN